MTSHLAASDRIDTRTNWNLVAPYAAFLVVLTIVALPVQADSTQPETEQRHRTLQADDAECFARWDATLNGWWVVTPGVTPGCVALESGDVTCRPDRGLATLEPYDLPDGATTFRCGTEVDLGAGCQFVRHTDEPFVCRPRSGIALTCERKVEDPDCARNREERERHALSGATAAISNACEEVLQINVINLYSSREAFGCRLSETRTGLVARCSGPSGSSSSARCDVNGGRGGCLGSSGSGGCEFPLPWGATFNLTPAEITP